MLVNKTDSSPELFDKTLVERFPHIHSDLLLGGIATTVAGIAVFSIGVSTEYLPSLRTIGSLSTMVGLTSFIGETARSASLSINRLLATNEPETKI